MVPPLEHNYGHTYTFNYTPVLSGSLAGALAQPPQSHAMPWSDIGHMFTSAFWPGPLPWPPLAYTHTTPVTH